MTIKSTPIDNTADNGLHMENILFVFGSARGGTTYLSQVLTQWFRYGMGPEGTFIADVLKKADKLGGLSSDENCHKLAQEIIDSQTFQIIQNRWGEHEGFAVTPQDIIQRMPDREPASAIYAAFKVMTDKLDLQRVGNKNPGYWRELDTLDSLFPDNARYLFIVRDGRDVALSLKNVPWGGHSVYEAASIWKNMIQTVKDFEHRSGHEKLLTIRYEDLLNEPVKTISAIGEFIGEKHMQEIRTGYVRDVRENHLRANFEKWRHEMSAEDQYVYEAVAGSALADFGYERNYPDAKLGIVQKVSYKIVELMRKIRVNIYHLQGRLPLDINSPKQSKIADLVKPGQNGKSQ